MLHGGDSGPGELRAARYSDDKRGMARHGGRNFSSRACELHPARGLPFVRALPRHVLMRLGPSPGPAIQQQKHL